MKSLRLVLFVITSLAVAVTIATADTEPLGSGTVKCLLGRRDCILNVTPATVWDVIVTPLDCDLGFVTCLRRWVIGR